MFAFNAHAQEIPLPKSKPEKTQLLLNMTVPCREDGIAFISETVNAYGEQEFASGVASIKPLLKPNLELVDLLMYVSADKRTFSIFSLQKVGEYEVACVIVGGHTFKPFDGKYRN